MGNMPTKKFSHSFKTVTEPGIFRIFLAVCSDFHYIAEKGVAHHIFIYMGHIFGYLETLWDALLALQCVLESKKFDDAYCVSHPYTINVKPSRHIFLGHFGT